MVEKILKLLSFLILGILIIPASCFAAGTTGAIFLNVGVSAKSEGMGGAYSAIADDSSAVTINPAGMVQVKNSQISVMHNQSMEDINQEYFSYVTKWGEKALGGSLVYLDYGSQPAYDPLNTYLGNFRPTSYALSMAYSALAGKALSYGVALKYIKSEIYTSSGSTFAVDAGVLYKPAATGWRYAAVLSNLGSGLKLDQNADPLPLTLKLGTAYAFDKIPLIAAFDIYSIKHESPEYHVGVQYLIQNIVSLRMGYNSAFDAGNGFTYGIGVTQQNYGLDYAFIPANDLGDSHRFSFNLNF